MGDIQKQKIEINEKWYELQPETMTQNNDLTILSAIPIETYRKIQAKSPDITLNCKKFKKCMIIDIAEPYKKNTSMKLIKKMSKYHERKSRLTRCFELRMRLYQ